jgi:hypothetical protein
MKNVSLASLALIGIFIIVATVAIAVEGARLLGGLK